MNIKIVSFVLLSLALVGVAGAEEYQYEEYNPYNESADYGVPECCDCGVYDAYRYFSVGVGPAIIIPNVGIGYRERYAEYGWDTGLSFSTVGYAHQLTGHWVAQRYWNGCRQNSPYFGLGLMGSGIVTNKGDVIGTLSPDLVIGKELLRTDDSRHFIEMHVAIPTLGFGSHSKVIYVPLMYIKYGFSF